MQLSSLLVKEITKHFTVSVLLHQKGWGIAKFTKERLAELLKGIIGDEMRDKKLLICGFRFFVGDCVRTNGKFDGYVQWVDVEEKLISVRFDSMGATAYSVVPPDQVEKIVGEKGHSTLITSADLKELYKKMSFTEKCFFQYNKGKGVKRIAEMASVSVQQVKDALRKRKDGIIYETGNST